MAVSSGVRYILTGFCSYGPPVVTADKARHGGSDDLHSFFMSEYCPEADGRAAGAGIRTGDTLRAVHLPGYLLERDGDVSVSICNLILM